MNENPRISIIIPCFNYGNYLWSSLDSIEEQTFGNWECIIIDDGSTDNTKDIAYEYLKRDNRYFYIYQENNGPSAARNLGIKSARGAYYQFLDADDTIEKKKLELQLDFMVKNEEVDLVYGGARYFSTDKPGELLYSIDGSNRPWMPNLSGCGKEILGDLIKRNIMVISAPLVRKSVFDRCGLFNESIRYYEDWEYWTRCALNNMRFHYLDLPKTLSLIRYHGASFSMDRISMLNSELHIRTKFDAMMDDKNIKKMNRKQIANSGITLALENFRSGHLIKGISQLIKYATSYAIVFFNLNGSK